MKRSWDRGLLQVICGAFLFILWAGPARAEVAQPKADTEQRPAEVVPPRAVESGFVIVTAESAEVRTGPSPNAEVIAVVDKGEIFEKLGRTMRWYLVKIDDEITGYISGRYIRRYQEGEAQSAYPPDYPNYPGDYYGNPYYYGVLPYFSWDWYFYGGPYRGYAPPPVPPPGIRGPHFAPPLSRPPGPMPPPRMPPAPRMAPAPGMAPPRR
jgi:hypothetical protein